MINRIKIMNSGGIPNNDYKDSKFLSYVGQAASIFYWEEYNGSGHWSLKCI